MPARRASAATQWDVVVIGGANTDYLVRGSRLPQPGETVQGDVFEPGDAGGKGANQAVAARLERAWLSSGVSDRIRADPHYCED